jgi:hypothetical protein
MAVIRLMGTGMEMLDAMRMARVQVSRTLPPLPFAKRHRLPKRSKNDNPVYRKVAAA